MHDLQGDWMSAYYLGFIPPSTAHTLQSRHSSCFPLAWEGIVGQVTHSLSASASFREFREGLPVGLRSKGPGSNGNGDGVVPEPFAAFERGAPIGCSSLSRLAVNMSELECSARRLAKQL